MPVSAGVILSQPCPRIPACLLGQTPYRSEAAVLGGATRPRPALELSGSVRRRAESGPAELSGAVARIPRAEILLQVDRSVAELSGEATVPDISAPIEVTGSVFDVLDPTKETLGVRLRAETFEFTPRRFELLDGSAMQRDEYTLQATLYTEEPLAPGTCFVVVAETEADIAGAVETVAQPLATLVAVTVDRQDENGAYKVLAADPLWAYTGGEVTVPETPQGGSGDRTIVEQFREIAGAVGIGVDFDGCRSAEQFFHTGRKIPLPALLRVMNACLGARYRIWPDGSYSFEPAWRIPWDDALALSSKVTVYPERYANTAAAVADEDWEEKAVRRIVDESGTGGRLVTDAEGERVWRRELYRGGTLAWIEEKAYSTDGYVVWSRTAQGGKVAAQETAISLVPGVDAPVIVKRAQITLDEAWLSGTPALPPDGPKNLRPYEAKELYAASVSSGDRGGYVFESVRTTFGWEMRALDAAAPIPQYPAEKLPERPAKPVSIAPLKGRDGGLLFPEWPALVVEFIPDRFAERNYTRWFVRGDDGGYSGDTARIVRSPFFRVGEIGMFTLPAWAAEHLARGGVFLWQIGLGTDDEKGDPLLWDSLNLWWGPPLATPERYMWTIDANWLY